MIEIDGSTGEGGGQVLRTSLSLSALTGQPVRVRRIRAGRSRPGLAPQHLTCARAVSDICGGRLEGDRERSEEVVLEPGTISGGTYSWDVGTAGAACLVLQTVLPPLFRADAPSTLQVTGGTHVRSSPLYEHLRHLFQPALQRLGLHVDLEIQRYGFYPKGGGRIRAKVDPAPSASETVSWTEYRRYTRYRIESVATSDLQSRNVGERQVKGVEQVLGAGRCESNVRYVDSYSTGTAVFVYPAGEPPVPGAGALGKKGKPAEDVGREAAERLQPLMRQGLPVDRYLPDQLLLPFFLRTGTASLMVPEYTAHVETQVEVFASFFPEFSIQKKFLDGTKAVLNFDFPP